MLRPQSRLPIALATALALSALSMCAAWPAAAASAPSRDVLSGTWQVSRTCLSGCVSPKPVLRVVHHRSGDVFVTGDPAPQVLYRMGMQVLVHGPKDSSVLTISAPGQLMTGLGVTVTGDTFKVTWRCVAPPRATAGAAAATLMDAGATRPARAPRAIEIC